MRQYLATMGVRTACFIGAFFFDGWLRWTCVVLAVVLPYIAVVLVNSVRPRDVSDDEYFSGEQQPRQVESA